MEVITRPIARSFTKGMLHIHSFIFNYFYENTYILYADSGECIIIDPGCSNRFEEAELDKFIQLKNLQPLRLINTHCHIDHILGNNYVSEKYKLDLETSEEELPVLRAGVVYAEQLGINFAGSPEPTKFLKEGSVIEFGGSRLETLFTPGHSPGHLSFFCREQEFIISGDVLFYESIGRTDLPGGDYSTLMLTIKDKYMTLNDEVKVYSGHGVATTIGHERRNNPFILQQKWN